MHELSSNTKLLSRKGKGIRNEQELLVKKRNLGVEGMLLVSGGASRRDDADERLSPSWRSVLRSRLAGRHPDDVVESTGWVLLSMDDEGDRSRPPPPLHSAIKYTPNYQYMRLR